MATIRSVTGPADLAVWEEGWVPNDIRLWKRHDSDRYTGTKAALIVGGYARCEWFPTAPQPGKRPGTIKRAFRFSNDLGRIGLRDKANGFWEVDMPISDTERVAREEQFHSKQERARLEREYDRAIEDEQKELTHMPKSHDAFRRSAVSHVVAMLDGVVDIYCDSSKYHGYRYAPEVLQALDLKMQEIREILGTGRTIFSPEVQQSRVNELKARVASVNPDVRAFLDRVTALKP